MARKNQQRGPGDRLGFPRRCGAALSEGGSAQLDGAAHIINLLEALDLLGGNAVLDGPIDIAEVSSLAGAGAAASRQINQAHGGEKGDETPQRTIVRKKRQAAG